MIHLRPIALLALVSALLSCSHGPVLPLLEEFNAANSQVPSTVQWPDPPEPARIRYLGAIAESAEFNPRHTLWTWLRTTIAGAREPRFERPAALCLSGSVLVVADAGARAVHLLDLAQRTWSVIERTPEATLVSPVGVACLAEGQILVTDSALEQIWIFDRAGNSMGRFFEGTVERPTGVARDPETGEIWLSETLAHRLRLFAADGRELMQVGSRGSARGEFNFPTYLAPDGDGGVWVNDSLNFRLQHVSRAGATLGSFGMSGDRAGTFARPRGLAVDSAGRIFSVDALFDSVQIFEPDGRLLLTFGGRGQAAGRMWLPSDVVLDAAGHAYVSDSYNRRIQVFAYDPPEVD